MSIAMAATTAHESEGTRRRSSDPISWYLGTIGREPLLTPAEEIELGNQVQAMMQLLERDGDEYTTQEQKILRVGRRSKARMMKANLRLVVSVAKKYQGKGLELLDLIQEGSLGLERAVEKFDPTRGYKFSTYAFWWIRQSMTRAIACQSRTIRLPVHLGERLSAIRKVSLDLAHKLGAMPSRREIAEAMDMPMEELDGLLRQALTTSSLDAPVNGDEGRSFLGDLIADNPDEEPLDRVERGRAARWVDGRHEADEQRPERHGHDERRLHHHRQGVEEVDVGVERKLPRLQGPATGEP